MKIKMVKNINCEYGTICRDEILTVRVYPDGSLFNFRNPFQVIEGRYSGEIIPLTHCILHSEEKTYTDKEWNDMENHYMKLHDKEHEQKERAQELVKELIKALNRKNALLEISAITIESALRRIKELEKA